MWRTSTRFERSSGAPSIDEAETEQNAVAPETESGPAERSAPPAEQTPAVRGVFTVRTPLLWSIAISPVSETPALSNLGMPFLFSAV